MFFIDYIVAKGSITLNETQYGKCYYDILGVHMEMGEEWVTNLKSI